MRNAMDRGHGFFFLLLAGRALSDIYVRWMDEYGMSSIAPSCRHQGRCLVEEGGNVTGWACLAYLRCPSNGTLAPSGLAQGLPLPQAYYGRICLYNRLASL